MNILLIEDNSADTALLQEAFAVLNGNYALQVAETVAEAVAVIATKRPEAVLLDLSVPDGGGLNALTTIQQASPDLPILILSGNDDPALAREAVCRGAQEYVLIGQKDRAALLQTLQPAIERLCVQVRLRVSEARFRRLFNAVPVGVFEAFFGGKFLAANATLVNTLGFETEAELIRASAEGNLYVNNGERENAEKLLNQSGMLDGFEMVFMHSSGKQLTMLTSAVTVVDPLNGQVTIEGTLVDITARKESERLLEEQAELDELTGLMNRRAFCAVMTGALQNASQFYPQSAPALLMFNVGGFKEVNDTLGHKSGDELLCQIATRVGGALRTGDHLARLGGDEFAVLCNVVERAHIARVAEKVQAEMRQPLDVNGQSVTVGGNIGIAMYLHNGTLIDDLFAAADAAMHCAKRAGTGRYEFAPSGLDSDVA